LYFALDELLVVRSGLLCLRRIQLRDAIWRHYQLAQDSHKVSCWAAQAAPVPTLR
jgi:hypothetical protein